MVHNFNRSHRVTITSHLSPSKPAARITREALEAEIKRFLANGGNIVKLPAQIVLRSQLINLCTQILDVDSQEAL